MYTREQLQEKTGMFVGSHLCDIINKLTDNYKHLDSQVLLDIRSQLKLNPLRSLAEVDSDKTLLSADEKDLIKESILENERRPTYNYNVGDRILFETKKKEKRKTKTIKEEGTIVEISLNISYFFLLILYKVKTKKSFKWILENRIKEVISAHEDI